MRFTVIHTIVRRIMLVVSLLVIGGIVAFYLLESVIEQLQQNIEQRALPVLRKDVPEISKNFADAPRPKHILACIPFCSAIGEAVVKSIKKPLIKRTLRKTVDDLNHELSYVKVKRLCYEEDETRRTITAECSYDITVILTGETFNNIIKTYRTGLTLIFACN